MQREGTVMKSCQSLLVVALSVPMLIVSTWGPSAAQSISAAEAQAIAAEAYLYFYPLVTMDVTRKQLINSDPKTAGLGSPPNTFDNIQAHRAAGMGGGGRRNGG